MNKEGSFRNVKNERNFDRLLCLRIQFDIVRFCEFRTIPHHVFHHSLNFAEFRLATPVRKTAIARKKMQECLRPQNFIIKCESNETEEIKFNRLSCSARK